MQNANSMREMAPPFPVPIVFPEVDDIVLAREAADETRFQPQPNEKDRPCC